MQNKANSKQKTENRIQKTAKSWQKIKPTCSTIVEDPLQISLFMQNKANFRKAQMSVNPYNTRDYENKYNWTLGENKPKQSQSKPILERTNVNFCATGYYESKPAIRVAGKPTFAVRKGRPNNPNVESTTAGSCGARIVAQGG